MAIFTRETLGNQVKSLTTNLSTELTCETHVVNITTGKENLYVIGIYRPPGGNLDNALDVISDTLDLIPSWKYPCILMGDVNVDGLTYDNKKKKLEDMLARHNITRLDLPPTRVTATSRTSIDLVCSNLDKNEVHTDVITTGLSDHKAQLCRVTLLNKKLPLPSTTHRHFSQKNMDNFKLSLASETWQKVYDTLTVDEAYDSFHEILTQTLNLTCPQKSSRTKKKSMFKATDEESERLRKIFLKALEVEKTTGREDDKGRTAVKKKDYDLYLKQLRKRSTSDFVKNSNNKQKAIWEVINYEKCKASNKNESLKLTINDNVVQDPFQVAEHLNHYFVTIADNILNASGLTTHSKPQTLKSYGNIPDFTLSPTSQEEILQTISSLRSKPSAGIDEFSSTLLKHCKEEIANPLCYIINRSFSQGIFPSKLKLAKVFPKLKKGPSTSVENYRPISILPTISKVIEKILLTQLITHLTTYNILTRQQHGFIKGRSTTTAIVQLTEYIIDQLEEGTSVTAMLLDFSKAFDSLGHSLLLEKIKKMGIRGSSHDWLASYLKDRRQLVEVNYMTNNTSSKARSTSLPINRGVPQGSILGPVLFVLLTNDLPSYLHDWAQALLYADDTALLIANKDPKALEIQSFIALNMSKQYCQVNDLVLNESKTQQLIWNGRRTYGCQGLPEIIPSNEAKYLGITIDDKLSWNAHTDNLCRKLNSSLYALKRIQATCDTETTKTAYFSLFESHLRYGLVAWGNSSNQNRERILVLQKKAMRILAGLNPLESCREAFRQLGILTVVSLYICETICLTLTHKPDQLGDRHSHNTRHASNYVLPTHHLTLFEKKPTYIGRKLFNHLPEDLKRSRQDKNFKKQLKTWLLQRTVYTIEEFLSA